jgi:hypothetical protein
MTFDPRDRFDIPDDREPEHHIPEAVCDVQTPLQRFYFTFGRAYNLRDNYVVVEALSRDQARSVMQSIYGRDCAFDYDERGFDGQPEKYGITQVPFGTPVRQEYPL